MNFLKLEKNAKNQNIKRINIMIILNFDKKKMIFRQRCLKNVFQMSYTYIIL